MSQMIQKQFRKLRQMPESENKEKKGDGMRKKRRQFYDRKLILYYIFIFIFLSLFVSLYLYISLFVS